MRRRRIRAAEVVAILFIASIALLIAFAAWIAPYSATEFHPEAMLLPPDGTHLFGTDEYGRDVFSRVIVGTRPTLLLALISAAFGVALGALTGLVAGYLSGAVDAWLMRGMDVLMSFPGLILAMLVIVMLGPRPLNIIVAIGLVFWPRSARLVRAVVMDLVGRAFIEAARSRGESTWFILIRELLPNVLMIIVVAFGLRVTSAILVAAALAYLGIGVTPPTPAWGLMVHDGQQFIEMAPWLIVFPCAAIAVTSIGSMMVGEWLRRAVAIPGSERGR